MTSKSRRIVSASNSVTFSQSASKFTGEKGRLLDLIAQKSSSNLPVTRGEKIEIDCSNVCLILRNSKTRGLSAHVSMNLSIVSINNFA